jgi:hypothetical protein
MTVWSDSAIQKVAVQLELTVFSTFIVFITCYIGYGISEDCTYDHRSVKTGHPVRSAIHKH